MLTCHISLFPQSIDHFLAVHSALKVCGFLIWIDVNISQKSQINFDALETGNGRCQCMAAVDCIESNVVIIRISNLFRR